MYDLSKLRACGEDVYISENVEIKRPHLVWVASHVAVDSYFYCTTNLSIGSYVHISPMVSIIGGVGARIDLGDFCTIASGCRIIGASDKFLGDGLVSTMIPDEYRDTVDCRPISMNRFSSLASNVVVMPGVSFGEGAVVGANSYVNHDIPEWEIWAGSPARFIRKRPSETMIRYSKEIVK
jgi:acetyltransferase-like isoleucine patch superfamily enzyme